LAGADRVKLAVACLAAGIKDPADFEGMQLDRAPELKALEEHERVINMDKTMKYEHQQTMTLVRPM
jgi:hypothetical protein